jgi:uncharacterized protein (TIGR03437 family)
MHLSFRVKCSRGKRIARALLALATLGAFSAAAADSDALAISTEIQARHLPYGTILDPIYASPTSSQIVGYTRCGDSALWTGAYVAAEAFRYKVTQDPAALVNVQKAIAGIKGLADVTGTNLLARCMVPVGSPYAQGISSEESANGIHVTTDWVWVGNTSRDQFVGVIFGLGAAYNLISDVSTQTSISDLVTRLIAFLTGHNWSVVMPDGTTSTSFLVRPDQILALLEVGHLVNPDKFSTYYDEQRLLLSATVPVPAGVDAVDNSSYFKFNLDYMTDYNLVRLDSSSAQALYLDAYSLVRAHTASHQNAFFNVVDSALSGSNAARDADTRLFLQQWLQRPKRDPYVDLTKTVPLCGSEACQPVPVALRPPGEYLWQDDPFQVTGGGSSLIENSGIEYILPYWMGRYYGAISQLTIQSAAAGSSAVAPGSIVAIYGSGLASSAVQAASLPLSTTLGGVTVSVTDAAGVQRSVLLYYVSPQQINLVVPDATAPGIATFAITNGSAVQTGVALVQASAPALFSMDGTGSGVAAATAIRVQAGNPGTQSPVTVFTCASAGCTGVPIDVGLDTPVFLSLYGTGIRNRSALANVQVTINGTSFPVSYAGAQPGYPGLDQVNVPLSLNLRGAGVVNVAVTVDGQSSNTVTITIQ